MEFIISSHMRSNWAGSMSSMPGGGMLLGVGLLEGWFIPSKIRLMDSSTLSSFVVFALFFFLGVELLDLLPSFVSADEDGLRRCSGIAVIVILLVLGLTVGSWRLGTSFCRYHFLEKFFQCISQIRHAATKISAIIQSTTTSCCRPQLLCKLFHHSL